MKIRHFLQIPLFIVTVVILLFFGGNTGANAANGKQVALIIGNGDYALNPIVTAANDVQAITTTLKELGYEVFIRNNLDQERMLNTVNAFQKALTDADLGLFFYVGHGVQYKNVNYLVPLGVHVESDWQIPETCVSLSDIADTVARSGVKTAVFMVDAARPNPLGTRFSPPDSGLAEMETPGNLHIVLADAPHQLTRQGVDPLPGPENISRFTSTVLELLKEVPDLSIKQFMQQLQLAVAVKSGQDRNPWYRLGKNDSISLYDSRILFAKKLRSLPKERSLEKTQAFLAEVLGSSAALPADDPKKELKNPWLDNPILVFHALLRDLEKLYDVKQMNLPENIYKAGLALLNAKYIHLMEMDETASVVEKLVQQNIDQMNLTERIYQASRSFLKTKYNIEIKPPKKTATSEMPPQPEASPPENSNQLDSSVLNTQSDHPVKNDQAPVGPETLLHRALTRSWPWPDPFLSIDLAAKRIAAEAVKEGKARSEGTGTNEKALDQTKSGTQTASNTPERLPESEAETLTPIDPIPVIKINPAIARFKTSLILERHKALLKQSRLPGNIKNSALTVADDHAREFEISSVSTAALFEEAMSFYHQQNRMALIISDGEIDAATSRFMKVLEERGFTVTTTTLNLWQDEIASQNEKLTAEDVGLIYVTSNDIPLKDLVDIATPSTSSLNMVIMDPAFSSKTLEKPIESVDTPPENMVIVLADTPTALKKDSDNAKETPPENTSPFIRPEGPAMAQALAEHLDKPGQTLTALFQKIKKDVKSATKDHLDPWWIYGSGVIDTSFQFNDSNQKFVHLLTQLDLLRYLEATGTASDLMENGWSALIRDHPDWTWFVEKGDLPAVLERAFATDNADERHNIALKRGLRPRFTNEQGMTFIYQPGGTFLMGSFPDEAGRTEDEAIAEKTINNGYYLMQTEVTQAQWQAVMGKNAASFSDCGPHCPVETVSWHDAQAYIKRLNGVESLQIAVLPSAFQKRWEEQFKQSTWHAFSSELDLYLKRVSSGDYSYRLPTEAQWEFACRSGRKTWFGFGSELWRLPEYAWYNENAPNSTQAVATKRAQGSGFYDLHGNVWEWCQDGQGRFKAVRGGSWYYDGLSTRCAKRYYVKSTDANYNVGFRLVAVPVATR